MYWAVDRVSYLINICNNRRQTNGYVEFQKQLVLAISEFFIVELTEVVNIYFHENDDDINNLLYY